MDDKIVCPHCGHEYSSETIQETKDFNKSNKFLCFLGCGKEFRVNSNALNGNKTINLYQLSKTVINSNKLIYLLILCIVATFLYSVFSNAIQQKYIQTALFSNDGKEVLEAVKKIKYYRDINLQSIIDRCSRKAEIVPYEEKIAWVESVVECANKKAVINFADPPIGPVANNILIFLLIVTAPLGFYRLYKKFSFRFIGILLIVIGTIGILSSLSMQVTVSNVYNIGLLQDRQLMVILFSTILIIGVITQLAIYIVSNKK